MKTHLTLEQLENEYWGEPEFDSFIVTRCHELRKIPLNNFQVEDLRLVVNQGFSLDYLMPITIKELEKNILVEAEFYEGDLLLASIGEQTKKYWNKNNKDWGKFKNLIIENNRLFSDKMLDEVMNEIEFIDS